MVMNEQVVIIDDDAAVCDALKLLMESEGITAHSYMSGEEFIENPGKHDAGCLLLDVHLPGMDGLELYEYLKKRQIFVPVIIMTGYGDIEMAVKAMKKGVIDFIEKPFDNKLLLESVKRCLLKSERNHDRCSLQNKALSLVTTLTKREHEVMDLLVEGNQNKQIAHILVISPRTVELHRAKVMEKLHAKTLSDVVRLSMITDSIGAI